MKIVTWSLLRIVVLALGAAFVSGWGILHWYARSGTPTPKASLRADAAGWGVVDTEGQTEFFPIDSLLNAADAEAGGDAPREGSAPLLK